MMYFYGWKFWEADKGLLQSMGNCHVSATTLASNFVGFQQRCLDAKTRPCQSGTFENRTASDRFWVRRGCNDNVVCVYNIFKKSMYTSWWNISSQVKGFSKWNKFVIPHASDLQLLHLQLGGLETPQGHKGASHPGHNATPFGGPRAYASWKMLENHKPEGTVGKARLPLRSSPWNKLWGNDNRRMAPKSLGAFCTMSRSPTSQLMV